MFSKNWAQCNCIIKYVPYTHTHLFSFNSIINVHVVKVIQDIASVREIFSHCIFLLIAGQYVRSKITTHVLLLIEVGIASSPYLSHLQLLFIYLVVGSAPNPLLPELEN